MAKQNKADQYIDIVGDQFAKLSNLPYWVQSSFVSVIPYFALIFGILGVALTLTALGIFTVLEPIDQVTGTKGTGYNFLFVLLSLVSSILLLSSFNDLHRRKISGWKRIYYSQVLALGSCIVLLNFIGVISYFIGFYILYQIRGHYNK